MQSYSVNVLVPNGVNNTRIYKNPTSQLRGYEVTRSDIRNLDKYPFLDCHCGIYFLFGEDQVYIGKSSNLIKRIGEHNRSSKKEFFDKCIIFTTENNSLTETYINYIEYMFINKVKENSVFRIVNDDLRLREPNITDFDLPVVEYLYGEISLYLSLMNYELYSDVLGSDGFVFVINGDTRKNLQGTLVSASCVFEGSQVEILKGSIGKVTSECDSSGKQKLRVYNEFVFNLERGNIELIDEGYFRVVLGLLIILSILRLLLGV